MLAGKVEKTALLLAACKELGLQEDIELRDFNGLKWTLEYVQSSNHPDFSRNMIKLERMLQEKTGKPIDLRLQPKADKNKRFDRNYLRGVEKL